jgi:hypothetical protein
MFHFANHVKNDKLCHGLTRQGHQCAQKQKYNSEIAGCAYCGIHAIQNDHANSLKIQADLALRAAPSSQILLGANAVGMSPTLAVPTTRASRHQQCHRFPQPKLHLVPRTVPSHLGNLRRPPRIYRFLESGNASSEPPRVHPAPRPPQQHQLRSTVWSPYIFRTRSSLPLCCRCR